MDARRVRRPLGMAAIAPKRLSALAAQDGLNVIAGRSELAAVEADQLPRRPVVSARPAAGACEAVASLDVFSVEAVVVATAGCAARKVGRGWSGSVSVFVDEAVASGRSEHCDSRWLSFGRIADRRRRSLM